MMSIGIGAPLAACLALFCLAPAAAQQSNMSFFVTSNGPGKGADLGGLAGAVNARDRIGKGPWMNAKGLVVAASVDDLHSANNKLSKANNLSENGEVINGRGDKPNKHDILTGSTPDGKAFPPDKDMTCKNYTSSTQGAVMLGHNDRQGLTDDDAAKSWNSSHPSRGAEGGCSQDDLVSTGGAGLLYCFAVN